MDVKKHPSANAQFPSRHPTQACPARSHKASTDGKLYRQAISLSTPHRTRNQLALPPCGLPHRACLLCRICIQYRNAPMRRTDWPRALMRGLEHAKVRARCELEDRAAGCDHNRSPVISRLPQRRPRRRLFRRCDWLQLGQQRCTLVVAACQGK